MVLTVELVGARFDSGCPYDLIMLVFSSHIIFNNINSIIRFYIIQIFLFLNQCVR